jgi:hypothetical protein
LQATQKLVLAGAGKGVVGFGQAGAFAKGRLLEPGFLPG